MCKGCNISTQISMFKELKLEEEIIHYQEDIRDLENIDGFYDFTYVEGISNNKSMFKDVSHLNTNGMKALIKKIEPRSTHYIIKNTFNKVQAKLNRNNIKIEKER